MSDAPPAIHPAPSVVSASPVRLAVVGCGGSRQTYGAVLPSLGAVEVAGLVDVDPVSARLWSRQIGRAPVVTDIAEALADPSIEAVLLTSPVEDRARQALAAAEAGKHVYCAAPISVALAPFDDLATWSARHDIRMMYGLHRRFDPSFIAARRIVDEGRIGRIHQIRCGWSFYAGWASRRDSLKTWRGVFEALATQTIDFCRWMLGDIHTVSADIDMLSASGRAGCQGNLILQHDRGMSIHHISRADHKDPVEQYLLTGDGGTLELAFTDGWSYDSSSYFQTYLHPIGGGTEDVTLTHLPKPVDEMSLRNAYYQALRHFALCVRLGREPDISAADGRGIAEAILAAYLSSVERIKVSLPLTTSRHIEALAHAFDEPPAS